MRDTVRVRCIGGPYDGKEVSVVDDIVEGGRFVELGQTIFIPDADYDNAITIHPDDEEFVPYKLHMYVLHQRIRHPSKEPEPVYYNAKYVVPFPVDQDIL